MNDLLPCPFCGGWAAITEGPAKGLFGTVCSRCGCWNDSRSKTEAEAIAAWNTRPAPTPAGADAVRAFEEYVDGIAKPEDADLQSFKAGWKAALAKAPGAGEVCDTCDGKGELFDGQIGGMGGSGKSVYSECPDCNGSGLTTPQPAPTAAADGLRALLDAGDWMASRCTDPQAVDAWNRAVLCIKRSRQAAALEATNETRS